MSATPTSPNNTPHSVEEWERYITMMTGPVLLEQAMAANTPNFVRILIDEEECEPRVVTAILRMFATQLQADGQEVPRRVPGAYIDLSSLLSDLED